MSSRNRPASSARIAVSPTMRSAYAFCSAIQARVVGLYCSSSHR